MKEKLVSYCRYWLLICIFMLIITNCVAANRKPEFTHNLGGSPISCSIYNDQASLAGIRIDDPLNKVTAILCKPQSINKSSVISVTYYYKGLKIDFMQWGEPGSPFAVANMIATSNDVATIDGVSVGMNESVLTRVYGTADEVYTKTFTAPKLSAADNATIQRRFGLNNTVYVYNVDACNSMRFTVSNGIIKEIKIHHSE